MKHEHEEAARESEIELEKENTTVAEAEVHIEMAKKKEHNKEIERKKYEQRINAMEINYNQALSDLNSERNENFT